MMLIFTALRLEYLLFAAQNYPAPPEAEPLARLQHPVIVYLFDDSFIRRFASAVHLSLICYSMVYLIDQFEFAVLSIFQNSFSFLSICIHQTYFRLASGNSQFSS